MMMESENKRSENWLKQEAAMKEMKTDILGIKDTVARLEADVTAIKDEQRFEIEYLNGDYETLCDEIGELKAICGDHKMKVILTSCLPAGGFGWHPTIKDAMQKIRHLNARVKAYAEAEKIPYVDYFSAMVSADGTEMNPNYAKDKPGVHPNAQGYAVMEGLLLPVIQKVR